MNASVIISFYNNIAWLKLALAGLSRQSYKEFEVIISDDGSREDIVKHLHEIKNDYHFPIKHVWHEDDGWQKNIILNKSIVSSNTEYLIFMDGDCIPHRHFIREHLENRKNKTVLAGRRVNLSPMLTKVLDEKKIASGYLESWGLILNFLAQIRKKSSHSENGIYARFNWIKKQINKKEKGILGSNFSVHKADILSINGFDERYKLPAVGEDTDIELRFRNLGIKIKAVKHLSIQYHLHHKTLPRDPANLKIYNENKKAKVSFTAFGINKEKQKDS